MGVTQHIPQGRSKAPPSCQYFSLGQHGASEATQARLGRGEHVMAFLDDIYTVSKPDRLADVHTAVDEELLTNAQIRLHHGKTQVWNRGGVEPNGMPELTRVARAVKPDTVVWRGDPGLPTFPARVDGSRHSHWTTSVRLGFSGEEVQGTANPL